MTGLVRRFSRRRNKSSSRKHCYYIMLYIHYIYTVVNIIFSSEFKLSCLLCNHQKKCFIKKKTFYVTKTKECRGKKDICPFFLLESLRPLSPPQEPRTPFSSWGTPDFTSTCLGIDSLTILALVVFSL